MDWKDGPSYNGDQCMTVALVGVCARAHTHILNSGKWPASNTAAVPPGKVLLPSPLTPQPQKQVHFGKGKILLQLPGIVPQFRGYPACGFAVLKLIVATWNSV